MTSRRSGLILVSVLLMVFFIMFGDAPIALFIAENTTTEMQVVGSFLEELGKSHWVLLYALIVIILAWRSWQDTAHRHIALFTAVAASGILANIVKVIICRPRPPLLISEGIYTADFFAFNIDWAWNSFPSGHATTGIAIAIAGSATWPKLKPIMWIIGLAIAFGRLIYNVHYVSDVMAGILLGALVSWWCVEVIPTKLAARRSSSSTPQPSDS